MVERRKRSGSTGRRHSGGMKGITVMVITSSLLASILCVIFLDSIEQEFTSLHRNLSQSQERLTSATDEIARLTSRAESMQEKIGSLNNSLDSKKGEVEKLQGDISIVEREISEQSALNSAAVNELQSLKVELRRDPVGLSKNILRPSVQVDYKGNVGSGTIIYSEKESETRSVSYLITAHHVIEKAITMADTGEKREKVLIKMYAGEGLPLKVEEAEIVSYHEKKDIALLRLTSDKPFPHVAVIADRATMKTLKIFTPIYTVGCPLGHEPLPTIGEIAHLNKIVDGERYIMMNAPTIFGNSGGGVFLANSYLLIGTSNMICTYDAPFSTPVPHLSVFIPMDIIYDWLDSQRLQYIYDRHYTKTACDAERKKTREASPEIVKATIE